LSAFRRVFPAAPAARATILVAVVAVCAAACTSSPSHAAASGASASSATGKASESVSAESAKQIAAKAIGNLKTASSLTVTDSVTESGQDLGLDVTLVKNQGCAGTVSDAGKGSLQLVALHSKVWIKPSTAFYKSVGATAFLPEVSGKWLTLTKSSELGSFVKLCTVNVVASDSFGVATSELTKSASPAINGQPTIKISQAGVGGAMYVSDAATPEVLRITVPGTGDLEFSDYGAPQKITAPPSAGTIDGGQFGL
jgi:hypothetical protein